MYIDNQLMEIVEEAINGKKTNGNDKIDKVNVAVIVEKNKKWEVNSKVIGKAVTIDDYQNGDVI